MRLSSRDIARVSGRRWFVYFIVCWGIEDFSGDNSVWLIVSWLKLGVISNRGFLSDPFSGINAFLFIVLGVSSLTSSALGPSYLTCSVWGYITRVYFIFSFLISLHLGALESAHFTKRSLTLWAAAHSNRFCFSASSSIYIAGWSTKIRGASIYYAGVFNLTESSILIDEVSTFNAKSYISGSVRRLREES